MSSEAAFRSRVIKILAPFDPHPVENLIEPGTPDVECTLGWFELKQLPRWPKRPGTIVRVRFEPGQVPWLIRRWQVRKGSAWVLLKVGREILLFRGSSQTVLRIGVVNQTELRLLATAAYPSYEVAERLLPGDVVRGGA